MPDKITYWQDLDSPFSSEEILDIIRSKFYSLKEPKPFSFVTHEEFREIRKDMEAVKATVTKLDEKVEELRGILPKVVILEEISREEGRKRVEQYFKERGQADIEELMVNLKIPVQDLIEIIDDMKKEGRVVPKGEKIT